MFITFEGPEGSGKSTVLKRLDRDWPFPSPKPLFTREPGSGEFGAKIRALLLEGGAMPALSELFLFLADRAHHVDTVIRPALDEKQIVISDRFADSTVVYQGARGLEKGLLRQLNRVATSGLQPDLTFLFDLDPEVGLSRITNKDRLDREPIAFHHAVRMGFLEEMELDPARWVRVDASQSTEVVFDAVLTELQTRLQSS